MATAAESLRAQYTEKRARLDFLANPTDEAGEARPATEAENTEFDKLEPECRGILDRVHKLEALSLAPPPAPSEGPDRRNAPPSAPAVHTKRHVYSLSAAIRSQLNKEPLTGLEAEVNEAIARRNNRRPQGIYIPTGASAEIRSLMGLKETRSLDTTAGAGLIFNAAETPLIEYLRPKLVVRKVGARFLEDVEGVFSIPRATSASQPQVMQPGVNVTSTNATYDQVRFTPHLVQAKTSIDPNLAYQSSFSAEGLIKDEITTSVGQFADWLTFNGPGGNSVTGLFQNQQIQNNGLISLGANGANPTFQNMIAMETAVASHNADRGKMGYVTTSNVRGYLKNVPKNGSGYPSFVWENPVKAGADGVVNGYDAYVTNIISSSYTKGTTTTGSLSGICFGNFDDLVVAIWEGWDLLVDPYTGRDQGVVNISLMMGMDVQVRHPESFSIVTDAKTS